MLVLTRKSEQKIIIGKDKKIIITILKVQGDQVSIGIKADEDTPIYREELLVEIEEANTHGAVAQSAVDIKTLARNIKLPPRRQRAPKTEKIK
jgi:carbon storage regulator